MKVMILAAGYGTRLYSLVKDTPKALLKIHDKHLIDFILERVQNLPGLNEVILVTNDKFYTQFVQWAGRQTSFPVPITIVNDQTTSPDNRLGSIGDIDFCISRCKIKDDILVIGSDNLFDYNIDEYIRYAQAQSPSVSVGLYDIGDLGEATKFGVVEMGKDGRINEFEEKPPKPKSTLVAMCFYYLPKGSLGRIKEYLVESGKSDKAGDYIRWLNQKYDVYGFKFTGKWYDIGSVEAYNEAKAKFL